MMYTVNKPLTLSPYDHPDIYPGPTPPYSFLYYGGRAYPLKGTGNPSELSMVYNGKRMTIGEFLEELGAAPIAGRIPMLAYGSNACLAQLRYKYSLAPQLSDIVINLKGDLYDTDVIYAAYMTKYGALPAMLGPMFDGKCQVWLTLLDEKQLEHITATERVYSIATHKEGKLILDCGIRPKEFYAYFYDRALTFDGSFFRFPDIPGQSDAQEVWEAHMLLRLSQFFGMEREIFIQSVKNQPTFRRLVQQSLDLLSVSIKHPDWSKAKKLRTWQQIEG